MNKTVKNNVITIKDCKGPIATLERCCAYTELIAGTVFADCKYCVFNELHEHFTFNDDEAGCNRYGVLYCG